MASVGGGETKTSTGSTAPLFVAILLLWSASVLWEIIVGKRTELIVIVGGFIFFQICNWVIRRFVSRDSLFINTSVSLIHSAVVSASVVMILVNQCWIRNWKSLSSMFEHEELVDGTWSGAYSALCFSSGYFAYDQTDMLRFRLYKGWIPSILTHHVILLACFTLALYRNVTINYLILTLICEFHSIFLHIRKLRRMAGIMQDVVHIEWTLNWVAFFTSRAGAHALITYKLITDAPKFVQGIQLPLALFGMLGMNILNLILGIDLFKAYCREKYQTRTIAEKQRQS